MISRMRLLAVVFLHFICVASAKRLYGTNEEWNRIAGEPGVKLRLTKKGANHIKNVGLKLLNERISQLSGINAHQEFSRSGLSGTVDLQNMRVTSYKAPDYSVMNFKPPSSIVFGMENLDISMDGRFVGTAAPFSVPGSMSGYLKRMALALTIDLNAQADGRMNVQMTNCSSVVGLSHFTLTPEGPLGPIIKTFEFLINDEVRKKIPDLLCTTLGKLLTSYGPKLFDRLIQAPLDGPFKDTEKYKDSVFDKFLKKLTGGLIIDNKYIADPKITFDYFETQQQGEVRYKSSKASTPFHPRKMETNDEESDRMLYFYASEYLFNSLLYHAYQTDRLSIKLEKRSMPDNYRPFFRTTCSADDPVAKQQPDNVFAKLCVGSLIPALNESHPNSTTIFTLLPHGLPDFKFADQQGSLYAKSRIITYVRKDDYIKQVLVSAAEGQADIRLMAEETKVSGDLKLNKMELRVHRSALPGMNPQDISQLSPLTKTILGPQLSKGLKEGVEFPIQDTIRFIKPELTTHDGYVKLATDFELGEEKLRKTLKESFDEGIAKGNFGK